MLAFRINGPIVILIMGFLSFLGMSKGQSPEFQKDPADAGRALRQRMLTTPPAELGQKPSKEFPRICGVLMDWPIGDQIATVFATSTGAASLYTTSTFGIIGGEGHETVRIAAINFVRAADRHFDSSSPTMEYPYPKSGRVRFYFLTYDGVRVVDTELDSVASGAGAYAELFRQGNSVLTELRLVTEKLDDRNP
jgi:hypothetical protein